jgi:hemerythrin superfamily protein
MTATRKTPTRKRSADALKLLTADHKEVKTLFKRYEKLVKEEADETERHALAMEICRALTVHATVEEEIFYPAARQVLGGDEDLVDEADIEHASAKELIAQLASGSPADDSHFDARVKVLGEYIEHHVKEEEGEMFPKIRKTELDLDALGEDLLRRKEALMAELGELQDA